MQNFCYYEDNQTGKIERLSKEEFNIKKKLDGFEYLGPRPIGFILLVYNLLFVVFYDNNSFGKYVILSTFLYLLFLKLDDNIDVLVNRWSAARSGTRIKYITKFAEHFLGEKNAYLLKESDPMEKIYQQQDTGLYTSYQKLVNYFESLKSMKALALSGVVFEILKIIFVVKNEGGNSFLLLEKQGFYLLSMIDLVLLYLSIEVILEPGRGSFKTLKKLN